MHAGAGMSLNAGLARRRVAAENPPMSVIDELRNVLSDEFEIDRDLIQPDAHLMDDLDIDSIDAIDMLARLRELTGKNLAAESLKNVRTVGDVVALVEHA